jgi:hypothetical protein
MAIPSKPCGIPCAKYMIAPVAYRVRELFARVKLPTMR